MRILIDDAIPGADSLFKQLGEVRPFPGRRLTRDLLADADALIVRSVTVVSPNLVQGTPVRFVGTATSGFDHVDSAALTEAGVHFAYAPGCNAQAVAEYVFTAVHQLAVRQGRDPYAMSLGVVGVGHVGGRVAEIAGLLGMKVLACDPPRFRAGTLAGHVPIDELLPLADILTLHVPRVADGPDATVNLIDANRLARTRPGAILINAARGGVVDEPAAAAARQSGRLSGLVLDVWQGEPDIRPAILAAADIATPHLAGYSAQSKRRGAAMIFTQLARWMNWPGPADEIGRKFVHDPSIASAAALSDQDQLHADGSIHFESPSRQHDGITTGMEPILSSACPIGRADAELRAASARGTAADEFDAIRSAFAKRNEFSHARLPAARRDIAAMNALIALGFQFAPDVP